jgi:Flp pilus assembly protein TadD
LRNTVEAAGRGNVSAAEAEVPAAIALNPRGSTGWYELGSVLAQSAEFQQAETAFRRAIELQPDFAKARYSLALTLIANPEDKQDWSGAIAECKEALKSQSNYPEALNLLGAALVYTGQADEAIPYLERALELSPALPEAHFNLGLALQKKDRLQDAEKELRRAIAPKGVYPEATSALARLLMQQGKNTEAETEPGRYFEPTLI